MEQKLDLVDIRGIKNAMAAEANNGLNVHDNLKSLDVPALRAITDQDRFPFQVMCMNLMGDANNGTIVRSAVLHGAEKVYIFGRRKYDKRGAVGAYNYVDVQRIFGFEGDGNSLTFSLDEFEKILQQDNLIPIFVEQGGVELQDMDWAQFETTGQKILLVFGNEATGVPQEFLDRFGKHVVSIPQRGVIRSFNVSTAMGIVTWDMRVNLGWI